MITVILLIVGSIVVIALIGVAYGANARKRSGKSGKAEVNAQRQEPKQPRANGMD